MYLSCHPNLNVVSGGVWVWKGFKKHFLCCEIFDYHDFMSEDVLANDLNDYTLSNGVRHQILEPGKRFRISYEDPARANKIDLTYEATMPPVMFESNLHFEQGMKICGELVLRGEHFDVDGHTVRDRTWGQSRDENLQNIPPFTWATGRFDDNTVFCITAFDHPRYAENFEGVIGIPEEQAFKAGWLHRNGETILLTDCVKKTVRNPETLYPESIEMELTDVEGNVHAIQGSIEAACRLSAWKNMMVPLCLVRWEYDGMVGHGEAQDIQSASLIYNNLKSL